MGVNGMARVTVRVPDADLKEIAEHVDAGRYPNQSEAIREAITRLLREEPAGDRPRARPALADGGR